MASCIVRAVKVPPPSKGICKCFDFKAKRVFQEPFRFCQLAALCGIIKTGQGAMALAVRPHSHTSIGKLSDLVQTHEKLAPKRLGVDWHFGLFVKLRQEPWLILDRAVEERADDCSD